MGLLRTLLIILLIYYGVKLIGRFAFPFVMKRFANKMEKRFNEQKDQVRRDQQQTKVGETVIDKTPNQQKSNQNVGEYVDFEEVD